ncbi:MAG TPA: hypothetical protein VIT92_07050 [Burkholderiaceae bacterium]
MKTLTTLILALGLIVAADADAYAETRADTELQQVDAAARDASREADIAARSAARAVADAARTAREAERAARDQTREVERAARDKSREAERAARDAHRAQFHNGPRYALMRSDGEKNVGFFNFGHRTSSSFDRFRTTVKGTYFYFQHDGKDYYTQDPAILARATDAFKEVDRVGAEMKEVGKKMSFHGKIMSDLGRKMKLSQPDEKTRNLMHSIGREMGTVGREQAYASIEVARLNMRRQDAKDEAQRAQIVKELDVQRAKLAELNQKMDKLQDTMSNATRQMEAAHKPMEDLGKQMEQAGKPMEEFGRQMGALGEKHDAAMHAAEPALKALAAEAVASGKATPI